MPLPLASTVLAVTTALSLTGCGALGSNAASAPTGPRTGGLRIVSTVAPITSIVASIAGDRATVSGVVPEGTNSHTFEPPPQIAAVMARADVVFANGLQLEGPTTRLAEANVPKGATIVKLGDRVLAPSSYIYDFSFPKKDGKPNPHLWTDPLYAAKYADLIRDTLVARDPANASYYAANDAAFQRRVGALATALRTDQATIPGGRKELLTYHDAYAYFARDFGWTIIGAVQPANFEDPQPKEIARLIDQIRAQKVPVIFGSEVFPSKVLQEIGQATGARYEDSLRDDDLPGKPGDAEHSWLGLMRFDYRTMIRGLGGTTATLDALNVVPTTPDRASYPQ